MTVVAWRLIGGMSRSSLGHTCDGFDSRRGSLAAGPGGSIGGPTPWQGTLCRASIPHFSDLLLLFLEEILQCPRVVRSFDVLVQFSLGLRHRYILIENCLQQH